MPKQKKQFKGTSKAKQYYDRKVHHTKTTRLLALGHIIPKDWLFVRIEPSHVDEGFIILRITKLMGVEQAAQTQKAHQNRK